MAFDRFRGISYNNIITAAEYITRTTAYFTRTAGYITRTTEYITRTAGYAASKTSFHVAMMGIMLAC